MSLAYLFSMLIAAFVSVVLLTLIVVFLIIYLTFIQVIKINNAMRRRQEAVVTVAEQAKVNGDSSDTLESVPTVSRDVMTPYIARPDTSYVL